MSLVDIGLVVIGTVIFVIGYLVGDFNHSS